MPLNLGKNKKTKEEKEQEAAILQKKTDIWKETKAKGYQDHSHCIVCGRAIHYGKKYCSMECKGEYTKLEKKKGGSNKWMCIIMGIMLPLMMLFMMPH
ncbi:MAG: DUF2116 family Zn-ribbon domain-containing protein [Promethearchaeota archaeon]